MRQPHPSPDLADTPLPRPFDCSSAFGGLDAAWVHLAGELDLARTPSLDETLHESLLQARLVVVDLRDLVFIDAAGVHAIVAASVRARQTGRRLVLVHGRPDVYRVFELTHSTGDVEIADLHTTQSTQRSLVSSSLLRTG